MGRPSTKSPTKGRKGKKGKDPNKPKRATSAYFYFLQHKREEFKRIGKNTSKIAEFTKECSEIWRGLSETEKKPFEAKAAVDKKRYTAEIAAYKGKPVKDDGKPKRPQTAYFLFLADFRVRMQGKNIDHKEIIRQAGEAWRNLSDAQKKPFENMAAEEQRKYEQKMNEWRKGQKPAAAPAAANGDDMEEDEDDDEEDEDDDEEDDE